MVSFFDLWELMESANTPLMDSGENSKAEQIVRAGNNIHKKNERSFWDEFIELCSNAEGMANLLDVDSSRVVGWQSKIRELLEKVENNDQNSRNNDEEKKVLPTGDNGAITMPDNSDPYIGGF